MAILVSNMEDFCFWSGRRSNDEHSGSVLRLDLDMRDLPLLLWTKGGAFTLLTAGQFRVYGPPGSIIGDNNQIALALLMVLPLGTIPSFAGFKSLFIVRPPVAGILLTVVAIVGILLARCFRGAGRTRFSHVAPLPQQVRPLLRPFGVDGRFSYFYLCQVNSLGE